MESTNNEDQLNLWREGSNNGQSNQIKGSEQSENSTSLSTTSFYRAGYFFPDHNCQQALGSQARQAAGWVAQATRMKWLCCFITAERSQMDHFGGTYDRHFAPGLPKFTSEFKGALLCRTQTDPMSTHRLPNVKGFVFDPINGRSFHFLALLPVMIRVRPSQN